MLECWVQERKQPIKIVKKLLQTHHFNPVKLFSISPGSLLHRSIIPIGAKPLSLVFSYENQLLARNCMPP